MYKKNRTLLKKAEIKSILDILMSDFDGSTCGLLYSSNFELLISLILAAQCTDIRVNIIRPALTHRFSTPYDMSSAKKSDILNFIKSCSFPNIKTKRILDASRFIVKNYNGYIPNTLEELIKIPGIGRKSANIIMSECFNTPVGIAVDTHVKRVSKRIGFTLHTDVFKIEQDLISKIPRKLWKEINHLLVLHGRFTCTSRKPKCDICKINMHCRMNLNQKQKGAKI